MKLSRSDDRRILLLALGAAGVTLALVLGIIGVPLVDRCAPDRRGLVACLRDMADRKFDLPGEPLKTATPAPAVEVPAESVVTPAPGKPLIVAEAHEDIPVSDETPPLPLPRPAARPVILEAATPPVAVPKTPMPQVATQPVVPANDPAPLGPPIADVIEPQPTVDDATTMTTASDAVATPNSKAVGPPVELIPGLSTSPSPSASEPPIGNALAAGQGGPYFPPAPDLPAAANLLPSPASLPQPSPDPLAQAGLTSADGAPGPAVPAATPAAETAPAASPAIADIETPPPPDPAPAVAAAPPRATVPDVPVPAVIATTMPAPDPALAAGVPDLAPITVPPPPVTYPSPPPAFRTAEAAPIPPLAEPETASPVALAPTIDAIELEGDASYVSGSGPAGALIRLFADGKLLGESDVEQGRWLVETGELLTTSRRELRVDAIEPRTGRALGTSTITVEIMPPGTPGPDQDPGEQGTTAPSEPPSPALPSDLATTAPSQPGPYPAPTAVPDFGSAEPTEQVAEETPVPAAPMIEPPVAKPAPLPTSDPPPAVSAPIPNQPLPAAKPSEPVQAQHETAAPALELAEDAEPVESAPMITPPAQVDLPRARPTSAPTSKPLPEIAAVVPTEGSRSVTVLAAPAASLTELPATKATPSVITLVAPRAPALIAEFGAPAPASQPVSIILLMPFGDPVNGRYTGGKAIIRRGDTLWSIAHRYYGSGVHYRTIFKANRDLIHRPSRIFPGQVFDLPLVTEE